MKVIKRILSVIAVTAAVCIILTAAAWLLLEYEGYYSYYRGDTGRFLGRIKYDLRDMFLKTKLGSMFVRNELTTVSAIPTVGGITQPKPPKLRKAKAKIPEEYKSKYGEYLNDSDVFDIFIAKDDDTVLIYKIIQNGTHSPFSAGPAVRLKNTDGDIKKAAVDDRMAHLIKLDSEKAGDLTVERYDASYYITGQDKAENKLIYYIVRDKGKYIYGASCEPEKVKEEYKQMYKLLADSPAGQVLENCEKIIKCSEKQILDIKRAGSGKYRILTKDKNYNVFEIDCSGPQRIVISYRVPVSTLEMCDQSIITGAGPMLYPLKGEFINDKIVRLYYNHRTRDFLVKPALNDLKENLKKYNTVYGSLLWENTPFPPRHGKAWNFNEDFDTVPAY